MKIFSFENKGIKYHFIFLIIILFVFISDRYTKNVSEQRLKSRHSVHLMGDYLKLTYIENTGAAFGILKDKRVLLISVSLIAVIWIIWYYLNIRKEEWIEFIAMALIIGGACGNLYDRILNGYVVDFFDIGFAGHRWPAFNIADLAISSSIIVWIIYSIWKDYGNTKKDT